MWVEGFWSSGFWTAGFWSGGVAVSGGSSALVSVTAAGDGAKSASGGSNAPVAVTAVGGGTTEEGAAGGSSAPVSVTAAGDGAKSVSGGSNAPVSVSTAGAGSKTASGGSNAPVAVTAVGGGTSEITEEDAVGGSSAPVSVTAAGDGAKSVSGGSSVVVAVTTTGAGGVVGHGAWAFVLDGHIFYVLSDMDGETYVCDMTTGQWHHWYTGPTIRQWNMYRGIVWNGRAIACDSNGSEIWEVDPDSMLDEGTLQIQRVVTAFQPLRGSASVRQGSLRVTASVGEPTADPATVRLRFTDDGGASWSTVHERTLEEDAFGQVLRFRSLGRIRAPGRIWEISDTGGLVRVDGADADVEGM